MPTPGGLAAGEGAGIFPGSASPLDHPHGGRQGKEAKPPCEEIKIRAPIAARFVMLLPALAPRRALVEVCRDSGASPPFEYFQATADLEPRHANDQI